MPTGSNHRQRHSPRRKRGQQGENQGLSCVAFIQYHNGPVMSTLLWEDNLHLPYYDSIQSLVLHLTSTTTTSTMPNLKVTTSILYGIFVSEKSFLIGVRCLVKQEHTRMLALRVAGDHLPIELVDEIADHLYALEKPEILSRWLSDVDPTENYVRFCYGASAHTEAERRASERMSALAVNAAWISNSRPSPPTPSGGVQDVRQDCNYIHLSALRTRPSLSIALPPRCSTQYPAGITYPSVNGALSVTSPAPGGSGPEERLPADEAEYTPLKKRSVLNPRTVMRKKLWARPTHREPMAVSRLLSVEGLQTAMRDWNEDNLRSYVDLLGLCVIRTDRTNDGDDGERMKPGIFVHQGWEDE